jgi:DNA ligase-associated metallophosphoesterase
MTKTITIQNQDFILHPTGSVFWTAKKMLLISDVHLGKVTHFRKHGVAVPPHSVFKNFEQLDNAFDYFKPETIVFLGDLFHSKKNNEWDFFADWVSKTDAKIILVAGNHDVIDPKHYYDLQIEVCGELQTEGFLLTHHPEEREGFFNFSGHIHPGIKLHGIGKQSLQLPCFFMNPNQMILPAFGQFTGKYFLIPTEHDCVYAITKEEVVLIC